QARVIAQHHWAKKKAVCFPMGLAVDLLRSAFFLAKPPNQTGGEHRVLDPYQATTPFSWPFPKQARESQKYGNEDRPMQLRRARTFPKTSVLVEQSAESFPCSSNQAFPVGDELGDR